MATGLAFVLGAVLLILFSGDTLVLGRRGVGRALAGLSHLAMFFVPIMALLPATEAIVAERESGDLDFVLSQPVRRADLFRARWLGLANATLASLLVAFALVAALASARGFATGRIVVLFGLTALLALAFLSLGLCVSGIARTRARALTGGLAIWFALFALGTLGVIAVFARWGVSSRVLQVWSLLDPIEAYRLAAITLFDGDAQLLGPAGLGLQERLGRGGVMALAALSMCLWAAAAYGFGALRFSSATAYPAGAVRLGERVPPRDRKPDLRGDT